MNRKMALIAAVSAVALIAAWYMVLWRPANHQLAVARQQLSAAQNDRSKASAQHSSLLRKQAQLPAEEAKAAALTAAAPPDSGIDTVIDQIDRIATTTGVTWHSESQTQPSGAPASGSNSGSASANGKQALPSLTLNLAVAGTYSQVLAFVNQLQTIPRLVKVSALTLGGASSASPNPVGSGPTSTPASAPSAAAGPGAGVLTTEITASLYEEPTALPPPPQVKNG